MLHKRYDITEQKPGFKDNEVNAVEANMFINKEKGQKSKMSNLNKNNEVFMFIVLQQPVCVHNRFFIVIHNIVVGRVSSNLQYKNKFY